MLLKIQRQLQLSATIHLVTRTQKIRRCKLIFISKDLVKEFQSYTVTDWLRIITYTVAIISLATSYKEKVNSRKTCHSSHHSVLTIHMITNPRIKFIPIVLLVSMNLTLCRNKLTIGMLESLMNQIQLRETIKRPTFLIS